MTTTKEGLPLPEIPEDWQLVKMGEDGYACKRRNLGVIVSASKEKDNKIWWHISLSRKGGWLPDWNDVKVVKDCFVGTDKTAVIVLPPLSEYVNLNEVHHIWHCLEGDVTPDFTQGSNSI